MTMRVETFDNATLYLGDCREVLPALNGIDACVTDPPYGIEGSWSGGNSHGWGKFRGQAKEWDKRPEWFPVWLREFGGKAIVWGGNYFPLDPSGSWLVWDKNVRNFSAGHCELAWTNLGMPIRAFTIGRNHFTPEVIRSGEKKEHPTQKPLPLMEWCLGFLTRSATIVDPFMGSGTTGIACARMNKKFIGIEISTAYFDLACKRIEEAQRQGDLLNQLPPAEDPSDARIRDLWAEPE